MTSTEEAARAELQARQGAGARYDSTAAPADALLLARRGTAYFARKLNEVPDNAFRAPSGQQGWSRAMIVGYVGFHARALAAVIEGVRTGLQVEFTLPAIDDITRARTLSPAALRHLFHHAAKHLDVEWRDLSDAGWQQSRGGVVIADTPLERACTVWHSGVILNPGGQMSDIPEAIRGTSPFANM